MKEFIRKHEDRSHGVLSCSDRFHGYLPIMSGWAMAQFLDGLELNGSSLKPFLLANSERVKDQRHRRGQNAWAAVSVSRVQYPQAGHGSKAGGARRRR